MAAEVGWNLSEEGGGGGLDSLGCLGLTFLAHAQ